MTQRRFNFNRSGIRSGVAGLAAVLLVSGGLAGCFGGGDDSTPVPGSDPLEKVPDSATQSVGGFIAYLVTLANNLSDTREPIDVSGLTLPTSDTTEPETVN